MQAARRWEWDGDEPPCQHTRETNTPCAPPTSFRQTSQSFLPSPSSSGPLFNEGTASRTSRTTRTYQDHHQDLLHRWLRSFRGFKIAHQRPAHHPSPLCPLHSHRFTGPHLPLSPTRSQGLPAGSFAEGSSTKEGRSSSCRSPTANSRLHLPSLQDHQGQLREAPTEEGGRRRTRRGGGGEEEHEQEGGGRRKEGGRREEGGWKGGAPKPSFFLGFVKHHEIRSSQTIILCTVS